MERILFVKCTTDFVATTFPLGLMYLASSLREHRPDIQMKIIDVRLPEYNFERLAADLAAFEPDLVAISALSVELANAEQIARIAKSHAPETIVAIGGPHPSSDPKGTLENRDFDFAAIGEGEITFCELVDALEQERSDFSGILGLAWRPNPEEVTVNLPRPFIQDVGSIPRPAWDLVDHEAYWQNWSMANHVSKYHKYANLFTSRACPYRCTYCHDLFGKGFRGMSPEQTVDEMEWLQETLGVTHFEIVDDIFNANLKRAKAICRLMIERGIEAQLFFPNGLRTDMLDKELIGLLKQAGTHHISVAVETVTPRIQKEIKKFIKLDRIWENINECRRVGINTRGFFMIGFPGETKEEIRATIEWACRSQLTNAFFFIVIPFKGTELYREQEQKVHEMSIDYSSIDYWTTSYNLSEVSQSRLKWLQRYAQLRFYGNPARLWRIFQATPNFLGYFSNASLNLIRSLTNRQWVMTEKTGGWWRSLFSRSGDHQAAEFYKEQEPIKSKQEDEAECVAA